MPRENDSEHHLEPVGTGLGIELTRESRKIPISPIDNPLASVELLSSRQIFVVLIMVIVSRGDDFTPVAQMKPFRKLFFETNETMNCLAFSRHGSEPTYESREISDNA